MIADPRPRTRKALTLIELLVVITLILAVLAMGAAFYPKFNEGYKIVRGTDRLTSWLLIAKQRAKRDQLPTGVRLITNASTGFIDQLVYIQQPDPITGNYKYVYDPNATAGTAPGGYIMNWTIPSAGTAQVDFTGVDFIGAASTPGQLDVGLVQVGDYLEVNGGGGVYQINNVLLNNPLTPLAPTLMINFSGSTALPTPIYNFRILRQPRRLLGEDVLQMPPDVVIDPVSPAGGSLNIPSRLPTGSSTPFLEILFSPAGGVIGQGTGTDKICLWVRDSTLTPNTNGGPAIIAIQVRTGFIATHPVGPATNYYQYTQDGRSSGI
jgi:hypothetical protein